MRCYMHYEDPKSPFTLLVTLNESQLNQCTIADLIQLFLKKYQERHPSVPIDGCISHWGLAFSSKKKQIFPHHELVWKRVHNKDDLDIFPLGAPATSPGSMKPVKSSSHSSPSERSKLLISHAQKFCLEKNPQKAVQIFKTVLSTDDSYREALIGLVDIYIEAGRGSEALHYAKLGCRYHGVDPLFTLKLGQAYLCSGNGTKAADYLLRYSKELRSRGQASSLEKYQVQVALCQAYQLLEQKDMAIVVIQGVLRETQEYIPAVVEYAKLTFDLGDVQGEQAMLLLLSAIVNERDNKNIQRTLAELCRKPKGLEFLEKASGEAWSSVPAMVYLATILRNFGALEESLKLMNIAIELDSSKASSQLIRLHLLEVFGDYEIAFKTAMEFLSSHPLLSVADTTNDDLFHLLDQIKGPVYLNESVPSQTRNQRDSARCASAYSEDELQLVAFWFTIVKMLYLQGALPSIPPIITLLSHLAEGKQLHMTNIRNESAYFECIENVFQHKGSSFPCAVNPDSSFIYFVSDSHCISPAWSHITVQGRNLVIHPMLSTGTKIWHLCPESQFYPKFNFLNAIKKIPDHAVVIFCFGEIDCREALLRCVEKCYYDSIEEAMDKLLDVYVGVLEDLFAHHKWKILVHPVPPVIDVTRPVVNQFNSRLKLRIKSHPNFTYLNFESDLMYAEAGRLRDEYDLDGTHLNPSYVQLLASHIEAALS